MTGTGNSLLGKLAWSIARRKKEDCLLFDGLGPCFENEAELSFSLEGEPYESIEW